MNRQGQTSGYVYSGYPLCQVRTTVPGADLGQVLLGSGGQDVFFSPETWGSPLQPELSPMPSAPPMTPEMSSGPMPQPSRQPQPMGPTPEANASMPTSVGVDLGPHGPPETTWAMPCSRSRRQSPTAPQPTPLPQETPPLPSPAPSQQNKEAAEVA